ncbi:Hypothetical predicted protein [Podarcis lilfordi]|uniref:Uncharacterized protein n=1 Tax=Podarcis lilfordi TaxID=74358 RepID=A0AA35JVZ9_9SAUR|nr:Hypothetical predicted protein [Podarcis lilfordi]
MTLQPCSLDDLGSFTKVLGRKGNDRILQHSIGEQPEMRGTISPNRALSVTGEPSGNLSATFHCGPP